MVKTIALFSITFLSACADCDAQQPGLPEQDAYLREPRPLQTPRMFAPGKVSDALSNRDMAISPAGDELFYTVQSPDGQLSVIIYMHFEKGVWSKEVAPFSGQYSDLEPAFSPDGGTLFFASNRPPLDAPATPKNYDIWMIKKQQGKWASPVRLDTVINSQKDEFYPSVARNGNLYFTRDIENGKGKDDIVVSEWKNGKYQPPYSLPGTINTDKFEFNAFVDPDEQYLLFSSFGRTDDLGGGDLYLSCRNEKGEWQTAVHLDSTINSRGLDFSPFVTPDKKYLFFTSDHMWMTPPFAKPLNFKALQDLLGGPGNGLNDIYWMEWQPVLKKYSHAP